MLETRAGQVLGRGQPSSYRQSLTAVTELAFDRLVHDDPASASLAGIRAFLAPDPIPLEWFTRDPALLPAELAGAASDPLDWHQALARLGAHALARIDPDGLLMHRLTQALVRGHLSAEQSSASRRAAEAIVAALPPGDGRTPSTWPEWARLLPHLIFLNPELSTSPDLRGLAIDATWYLFRRGYWQSSHDLASRMHQKWDDQLGPDDPWTLSAAQAVATALWKLGRHDEACRLDEDTLTRRRCVLGEDHPDTLMSANTMAIILRAVGETQAARELDEDTLSRRRRVLGEDHPDTLVSANTMAVILRAVGETQAARELGEDTLARRRRILGEDHPDTLESASNLAVILRAVGETQAARELDEDTLARRRRVLAHNEWGVLHAPCLARHPVPVRRDIPLHRRYSLRGALRCRIPSGPALALDPGRKHTQGDAVRHDSRDHQRGIPGPARLLPNLDVGFFAHNLGWKSVFAIYLWHWVFGAHLGVIYNVKDGARG